ncbi:hypothetical protein K5X82_10330 [Halosquirtibacter xylanolyticus]|uniref:hypothetical protein n=1 Tax=Halosquirtibacter xylanolyticus TaxID=3374599 RepID=UPI003747F03B|nr:hypothetical protein K5X82_10330 [Prolixibacteraceae bacterium]
MNLEHFVYRLKNPTLLMELSMILFGSIMLVFGHYNSQNILAYSYSTYFFMFLVSMNIAIYAKGKADVKILYSILGILVPYTIICPLVFLLVHEENAILSIGGIFYLEVFAYTVYLHFKYREII